MKWLDSIIDSMDMSLSKLWEIVKDRKPRVLQSMGSQRVGHNLATEQLQQFNIKKKKQSKMDVLYSKVTIVHNAIHCVFESC